MYKIQFKHCFVLRMLLCKWKISFFFFFRAVLHGEMGIICGNSHMQTHVHLGEICEAHQSICGVTKQMTSTNLQFAITKCMAYDFAFVYNELTFYFFVLWLRMRLFVCFAVPVARLQNFTILMAAIIQMEKKEGKQQNLWK